MCKHVRREVRTLNPSDRERYLEALEVFHTISHADGAAAYGSSFRNGAYFAALHNAKDYCYHNNLVFLTSHPAFNLQVGAATPTTIPTPRLPPPPSLRSPLRIPPIAARLAHANGARARARPPSSGR